MTPSPSDTGEGTLRSSSSCCLVENEDIVVYAKTKEKASEIVNSMKRDNNYQQLLDDLTSTRSVNKTKCVNCFRSTSQE